MNHNDIVYLDEEGRPQLDDDDPTVEDASSSPARWRMFFGGDLASVFDKDPLIVCQQNLTSEIAQSVSDEIMPGVYLTSHLAARALVEEEHAQHVFAEDFFAFQRFCGWNPGQLEKEVKRGS